MKYNAILKRRYQTEPVKTILELEIPDNLDEEQQLLFAAQKLTDDLRVELEEINDFEND